MAKCSINNCREPRCRESKFWCKQHYILFRAAGMAHLNATPPDQVPVGGRKRREQRPPQPPVDKPATSGYGDLIARQLRPYSPVKHDK